MDISSIQQNQVVQTNSGLLKETQAAPATQPTQEQPTSLQQPLRSDEQEPQISPDGSRLAAVANGSDQDNKTPAITDSKEAQQVKNQLQQDIQNNPTEAGQSQKASAAVVSALISNVA